MAEHANAVRARQMAELANEAKSRFLAVISHEIRTPMNGILGVLQLLDRERADAEERRLLEIASASSATLTALIDAILDYARLEAGSETIERSDFDLRRLIEAAAGLMRPQAQAKGLAFELRSRSASLPSSTAIRCASIASSSIFSRMRSNSPRTVRLVLPPASRGQRWGRRSSASPCRTLAWASRPICKGASSPNSRKAMTSIARRFGGLGLGLAISRQLAELMGGSLDVESAPGRGSTFRLELPLVLAAPTTVASETPAPFRRLRVLVVDDDPLNREVAVTMLRRLGHHPAIAQDGKAAVEKVEESGFDVVLMDLNMPGMDGFEAASHIQSLPGKRKPRMIALTADLSEGTRARLAESGISGMVGKPIVVNALRRALAGEARESAEPASLSIGGASAVVTETLLDTLFLSTQEETLGLPRLRRLRGIYADSASELLEKMRHSASTREREDLRRAAHRLGSAASALGLARLFQHCNSLEAGAKAVAGGDLPGLVEALGKTHEASLEALDAHLDAALMAAG